MHTHTCIHTCNRSHSSKGGVVVQLLLLLQGGQHSSPSVPSSSNNRCVCVWVGLGVGVWVGMFVRMCGSVIFLRRHTMSIDMKTWVFDF